jgi:hypothetical protein
MTNKTKTIVTRKTKKMGPLPVAVIKITPTKGTTDQLTVTVTANVVMKTRLTPKMELHQIVEKTTETVAGIPVTEMQKVMDLLMETLMAKATSQT